MHNELKRTISVSGGFGRLQMKLELNIGQYAREDAGLSKGVNCEIPHWFRGERSIFL